MRIEDYAMIGDCQTAALVSKEGSIDWLCLPRFDSDACFAALLGTPEHGRWKIGPADGPAKVSRHYRENSLILETFFETDEGTVKLIDFMPVRTDHADVIRIVEGVSGSVALRMEFLIRFNYGTSQCWIQRVEDGITAIAGPDQIHLKAETDLHRKKDFLFSNFNVAAGERKQFVLSYQRSYRDLPAIAEPEKALKETEDFWNEWSSRCTYEGPWKKLVLRSLITLKGLVYSPTGGIVAAPTTSLPEKMGGKRNWDYRYCWLRDATFSLYSLLLSGYREEARAWTEWLMRAVAGNPDDMQILYGVAGERRITEWIANWLPGYRDSVPVRIGNAAHRQLQLDVYGEIMDAMFLARRSGLHLEAPVWNLHKELIDVLSKKWKQPDEGIWEVRGPRRHFTHSKLMAWVAVDRCIKIAERFDLDGPLQQWRRLRNEISVEICEKGFNKNLNSFVQYYGSKRLDAALLMLPLVGFLEASDPRVQGTVDAIQKNLKEDGFVLRYRTNASLDRLPPGEGVFLPCSFWLVDNLILQNRYDEASELYERLTGLCNDVGLISEEYDPVEKILLGNFPQAFSHVSLINSAWNLSRKEGPARHRKQEDGTRQ
jgi:GH15 family glucan-1,4-alpha-glucosidase